MVRTSRFQCVEVVVLLWLCCVVGGPSVTADEPPSSEPPVSFVNDVVPIFSRYGCNAGSCHGAARGKDGFRLSLFGYDPQGDYRAIVRELPGRRIDLAMPEQSLLLAKVSGAVTHTGGKLLDPTSAHYQQLLRWIKESPEFDGQTAAKVVEVSLAPQSSVLNEHQATETLTVTAKYSNDEVRDVTELAYFSSSNPDVAFVSPTGAVTAKSRGEAFVMARFGTHTVGSPFIVHAGEEGFDWPDDLPEANFIDTAIHQKLKQLHVIPSDLCTDAEFLRRVSVDLSGRLPDSQQLQAFLADDGPDKRARKIDELLAGSDFDRLWTMKWAELLRVRTTNRSSEKATSKFANWLKTRLGDGVAIDDLLKEMLLSSGSNFDDPATSIFVELPNRKKLAEDIAQVFLGMRIQCAQCHNHPFDRWTMDDYYGFVAFFDQTHRKRGTDPRERIVFTQGGRTVHPVTKTTVQPRFLGGDAPDLTQRGRRETLAEWMASPDNPYFARNLANRLWDHFFGRGIVDEVDDVRISNPPVNEALLTQLSERLIAVDFNAKLLARDICLSHAYQRSTQSNETNVTDERNFSKANLRRIRAEVLLDVISQVTKTTNDFIGLPRGASATEIPDGKTGNHFLKTFGQSTRNTVCSCEVDTAPNLSQALHLINGDTVQRKIVDGAVVKQLLGQELSNREVVDELYLRCLARVPTDREWETLAGELPESDDRQQALEDIFWALLNSPEFLFNH